MIIKDKINSMSNDTNVILRSVNTNKPIPTKILEFRFEYNDKEYLLGEVLDMVFHLKKENEVLKNNLNDSNKYHEDKYNKIFKAIEILSDRISLLEDKENE